ncbi:MAG: hypothetical protein ACYS21_17240, partial [Planctomycetota bacterium]
SPFGIESEYIDVLINEDGLVEIESAFDRAAFCGVAADDGLTETTVLGLLTSGQYFGGTDTIHILTTNLGCLSAFASRWLQTDCGSPGWCDGLDLDRDSIVNFVDFAAFNDPSY